MALKEYEVEVLGIKHTVQLTEEQAKKAGAKATGRNIEPGKAPTAKDGEPNPTSPDNQKSKTPENKSKDAETK